MSPTLRNRIAALTDDELVRLLTTDADQYRDEALEIAGAEAARRGLDLGTALPEPEAEEGTLRPALRAFGEGVKAHFAPDRYLAAGKVIVCTHCGHDHFDSKAAIVNSRAFTFFDIDWMDPGARVLTCTRCGLIHWFRTPPERESD